MWGCLILFAKAKFRCKLKWFRNLIKKIKGKFPWVKIQGFLEKNIFGVFVYLIVWKMFIFTNGKKN